MELRKFTDKLNETLKQTRRIVTELQTEVTDLKKLVVSSKIGLDKEDEK